MTRILRWASLWVGAWAALFRDLEGVFLRGLPAEFVRGSLGSFHVRFGDSLAFVGGKERPLAGASADVETRDALFHQVGD